MLVCLDPAAENRLDYREGEYKIVRVEARATGWEVVASLHMATQSRNEIKRHNEKLRRWVCTSDIVLLGHIFNSSDPSCS
jgi:hypothetical protein